MVKEAAQSTPNDLLKAARQERAWTQRYVADQIGAPSSLNVTRWERGNAVPSAYYAQRLCQLFGKSMQELGLLQDKQPAYPISEEPITHTTTGILWNIPYRRNPFFTGREALLTLLQERLHTQSTVALTQSYALHGLGGIGKTQLAVEYAYRYYKDYQAIFWVHAASRETLIADFVHLGTLLHLPGSEAQDQMSIVIAVKSWLTQQHGWLLIMDNAEDLTLLTDFLPTGPGGHLLLTTRTSATGTLALNIAVDRLDQEESCLFLLHRANLLAPTASLADLPFALRTQALELVNAVDGLPLALDQAAAYIEETGCGLAEYLELYQQHHMELLQWQSSSISNYPYSVASTWQLSFQRVEEADPASADLLRLCAFLDSDAISEEMLIAGASTLDIPLGSAMADKLHLNKLIGVLRRFSLVQRDMSSRALIIHRLVQAVLKGYMTEEIQRQWAEYSIKVVNAAFPELTLDSWSCYEQCLPHSNNCSSLIRQYHFITPEAGRLLTLAGRYLKDRGLYAQANTLLSQGLSIWEQLLSPNHPETVFILICLGELAQEQGLYEQSMPYLQRALAIRKQELGADHPDVATVLHVLGHNYVFLEQYEAAEAIFQRTLRIREQQFGPEHPEAAFLVAALAQNNLYWGRYAAAEKLLLRALPLYERSFAPEHPYNANIQNSMSRLYCYQGKYEQAKLAASRSLQAHQKLLGLEHPLTATSMDNLAMAYLKLKNFAEAATLYKQTLSIHEKMEGPEHPHTGRALSELAQVYTLQGNYEQAEPLHLRALAIYEKAVGKESLDVASVLCNIAHHHYLQKKYEHVEMLCLRALRIYERVLDPENAQTAFVLYLFAQFYEAQGHYRKALSYYQQALTMREHVLGPEHPDTITALNDYTVSQSFIR